MAASSSERRAPVILVATANEEQGARHLRSLALELRDIVAALDDAQRGGICEIVTLSDATPEQVVQMFQHDAYRDRIAVLHFAGHAGPEGLLFEQADGTTAVADAGGLAAFLGCQRGLQLVVLNACATQAHVDALREAGVGAVVATSKSVEDAIAHQFAVLLYQGLGSGAGIKRAYDEAAAGVRFKHGAVARGSTAESMHASADAASRPSEPAPISLTSGDSSGTRDIKRKGAVTTDDGRWPWDLYFRRGAEESVGPWALPEAAGNPLFGLPGVPEGEAPLLEPFRHLRPFAREHAEVFFGRGKDIRELYDKVTSAASEPVILLYGATGVGKSSLLDAGLLPRLTGSYEVKYAPRDRTLRLLGTLMRAVGGDTSGELDAARVAAAWTQHEQECGRPLFVVIDQIEEAYTTEDAGHAAVGEAALELDAFASAIASLFAGGTRPRGRLVLAFRKEWLSEVKGALETHRVARTEHRLEQLSRGGVLEAITGPTRVSTRRMPTRLELEPGLDVLIADDLLAKRASHVAPLLQILLATMWTDAPRRSDVVRFDAALYESVQAKSKQLDQFLTQQLDAIRTWHAPAVDSGLALEFLRFYTTAKGTSDQHTIGEEQQRYPSANERSPGLRAMCARLYLLVERTADDAGTPLPDRPTRLAHDTLAPIVRERFERSDLPGPRAKRILDGRSAEWKDGKVGTALDAEDLRLVEEGERGMRVWNDEENALIAASRVARERARRRRAWVIRGAVAAVVLIAGFGVGSWALFRQSQTRLAESTSRELSVRALSADAPLRDVGLLYAVAAYEKAPTFEARRALFTQLGRDPSLIRVASTGGNDMVFASDGKRVLLEEADGNYSLDLATGEETLIGKFPFTADPADVAMDPTGTTYGATSMDSSTQVVTLSVWDAGSGRKLGDVKVPPPNKQAAGRQRDSDFSDPPKFAWQVGPLSADGHRLVAGSQGNDVVLWDLESGLERRRLRGHTEPPTDIRFSADGSVIVTSTDDTGIIAWSVSTGKAIKKLKSESYGAPAVAISRDNTTLAVAESGADAKVAVWPLRTNQPARRLPATSSSFVAFMADGALVVASSEGEVRVFERPLAATQTGDASSPVLILHGTDAPQALSVSASGRRIAVIRGDGVVHAWDLADEVAVRRSTLPLDSSASVIGPMRDGRLAGAMADESFDVWDITAATPIRRARHPQLPLDQPLQSLGIRIGAAGRLVLIPPPGGDSGWRYLMQGASGPLEHIFRTPGDATLSVDPVRPRVAYGVPGTSSAIVADLVTGAADTLRVKVDPRFAVDTSMEPTVEFSPRGDLLLVQATQFSIYVWDLATKQVRDSLTDIAVYANLLASDDGSIVAATDAGMVQFWRRGSREPSSQFLWKLGAPPRTFALSPNGGLFAYDRDGKVTLGDVARGDIIGEIETGLGSAIGLAFVDDGRAFVAVNSEGRVARIATDPDAWVERACAIAAAGGAFDRVRIHGRAAAVAPPQRCRPEPVKR